MKKRLAIYLLCAMLLASIAASAQDITHDRAGNPISVPEEVQTIISLAPAITQVLVDLGISDHLIAIDTYSAQMMDAEGLVTFDMMAPDIEQIVALSPDLIIASNMTLVNDSGALSMLSETGATVAIIPASNSIDAIMEDILFIGALVGKETEASELLIPLESAIEQLHAQTDRPVPVYFEIGSTPALYSFGGDTFLNEMIEILGGRNIFGEQSGWLAVSEESILAAAPEIIFTNETWVGDAVSLITQRPGWENIPAVQNGKVFMIDDNASSQANHHIVDALEEMAEAFK